MRAASRRRGDGRLGDRRHRHGRRDTGCRHPDAAPPDGATADAATADAAVAPVAITVDNDLGPEPSVLVVFQDSTGAVLAQVTTDANGVASQVVPAGSQVTAIMGSMSAPSLLTIEDVAPGDVLTAYNPADTSVSGAQVATTVQAPALPTSAADFGPDVTSEFSDPVVLAARATFMSGYADFRARAATLPITPAFLATQSAAPMVPPLPTGGTLWVTGIVPLSE